MSDDNNMIMPSAGVPTLDAKAMAKLESDCDLAFQGKLPTPKVNPLVLQLLQQWKTMQQFSQRELVRKTQASQKNNT